MPQNKKKQNWFVYLIETKSGVLYCGITTDLERRFEQHKSGKGAKFFRRSPPKKMVYSEKCKDRSHASKREYEVKSLSKSQKLRLISSK